MEAQAAVRGVGRAPTPLPAATALLVIRLFVCLLSYFNYAVINRQISVSEVPVSVSMKLFFMFFVLLSISKVTNLTY